MFVMNKIFKFFVVSALLVLISNPVYASSDTDCIFGYRNVLIPGKDVFGFVSMQGHYADEISERVLFPYGIFCYENFTKYREDGDPVFKFSDPNTQYDVGGNLIYGSGHAAMPNSPVDFRANSTIYFGENKCTTKQECDVNEICVAKISNTEQGHLADCNDNNLPFPNDFLYKICCEPTEYCQDDIDNTGDGNIDCASPTCHPSEDNLWVPQECTGNNQTSSNCVIGINSFGQPEYNETCINNPNGQEYYCSYGQNDVYDVGHCCPAGEIAFYDEFEDKWSCREPTQCGLGVLPQFFCEYNFLNEQNSWLNSVFSSEIEEWCVSYLPKFHNPLNISNINDSSMGCCLIIQHAHLGYYYHGDNVKIFGLD